MIVLNNFFIVEDFSEFMDDNLNQDCSLVTKLSEVALIKMEGLLRCKTDNTEEIERDYSEVSFLRNNLGFSGEYYSREGVENFRKIQSVMCVSAKYISKEVLFLFEKLRRERRIKRRDSLIDLLETIEIEVEANKQNKELIEEKLYRFKNKIFEYRDYGFVKVCDDVNCLKNKISYIQVA